MSADQFINRMLVLYGPPDSPDEAAFVDEYREMLAGYDPKVLKAAGDLIRNSHMRRGWPVPGEIVDALRRACSQVAAVNKRPGPQQPPEEFEFVGPEDERYVEALTRARTDAPAYARMIEARGVIKVRKEQPGPMKREAKAVLTDISRRMTGERD